MTPQQEKKNEGIALITSLIVHALLFVAFLFIIAWKAPNPPLPEYGIELNFGMDSQGSGEVQPVTPSGSETPENNEQQEVKNDVPQDEVKPTTEEQSKLDQSKPEEQPVTHKIESPVSVKEEKKVEPKPTEKPVDKPGEKAETKTEVKPKQTTENKSTATTDKTMADSKEGKPVSQGDKTNVTGDQGNPKGTPDAKALYGQPGGGTGGSDLDLDGWTWDNIPHPDVPPNETGRIVFEIKVNAEGELEGYRILERSVSPEAESACRKAIEELTFTRIDGNVVPAVSTGKITFIFRLK